MTTQDRIHESHPLRRLLWSTLLGETCSAALAEDVLAPLLDEYEVVRMSFAWWRLAPGKRAERVRRGLLVDACATLDVYDACAAAYITRLVRESSAWATPAAIAHLYTVQYLWRSMTGWPVLDVAPRAPAGARGRATISRPRGPMPSWPD